MAWHTGAVGRAADARPSGTICDMLRPPVSA